MAAFFAHMVAALTVYLTIGALVMTRAEGWPIMDAVYFCIVTMSTVGYGDLNPSTAGTRAFTVFLIIVGTIALFKRVSDVLTVRDA